MQETPPLPQPQELDLSRLERLDLDAHPLEPDAVLRDCRAAGGAAGAAERTRWSHCCLERARLNGVGWTAAHWEDMRLQECDLANAVAGKLYAARVELDGCRLLGLRAAESTWRDARWTHCIVGLADLTGARFERAVFLECDFHGADLTGCDLRGAVFRNCRFKGADFTGARLDGADWRGSEVAGVRLAARDLRGLIVTAPQAAYFARLLGLKVQPEPEDAAPGAVPVPGDR